MLLSSTVTWRGMQDFERIEMNKGIIEARTLADNELKRRVSPSSPSRSLLHFDSVLTSGNDFHSSLDASKLLYFRG